MVKRSCLALVVCAGAAAGQTNVGGPIVANTTWTPAGSPYIVATSIVIGGNSTLTIEAGVVVRLQQSTGIAVGSQAFGPGGLVVNGTAASPVRFTSNRPFATNPSDPAAKGDWNSIVFSDTAFDAVFDANNPELYLSGSKIEHAVIEFGGGGTVGGMIEIQNSTPYFRSLTVRDSARRGIVASLSSGQALRLIDSLVTQCGASNLAGGGVSISGGANHRIERCTFTACVGSNGGGLNIQNAAGIRVIDNVFQNNSGSTGGGMRTQTTANAIVSGNLFTENSASNSGGLSFNGAGAALSDNVYSDNAATSHNGGLGVSLAGSVLRETIVGNTATFDAGGGTISADVIGDLIVTGNTAGRDVGGIRSDRSGASISNCLVSGNAANSGRAGGMDIRGNNTTVEGCTITNNQSGANGGGLYSFATGTQIIASVIENNQAGASGGGVYFDRANWRAVETSIVGNSASNNGGGVFVAPNGTGGSLAGDQTAGTFNTIRGNSATTASALYYNVAFNANGSNDLNASFVCWGTDDLAAVQTMIFDFFDDSTKAIVGVFPLAPCPSICAPDMNGDGVVDADDFFIFLQFFASGDTRADFNGDGVIDADDFFAFLGAFAAGC
ncbi:MAG: hypothetical protein JJU33_02745 [Phycisphaerales bacterium]|nr:hypothetical protein [Phycisphaerales bacterium]